VEARTALRDSQARCFLTVNLAAFQLLYGYYSQCECTCGQCTKLLEFTEKNIRTDLDAMQEMVEINSQSTPTTVIDGEVMIGFDKEKMSEKLGL
jgi:hypothetical protein